MSGMQQMLRNAAAIPFAKVLDAITANAIDLSTKPAQLAGPQAAGQVAGLFSLQEAPWLELRAYLLFLSAGAYTGSANNKTAVIDVGFWPGGNTKGLVAARLTLTGGAETITRDPTEPNSAVLTAYECDLFQQVKGLVRPEVRTWPDTQGAIYLPTMECASASLHAVTIAGGGSQADRVIVLARPAWTLPEAVEIPFKAGADISSSTPADKVLAFVYGGLGATDMSTAAGSGWEYVVKHVHIVTDAAVTACKLHTATSAAGVVWGPFGVPANAAPLLADELRVGENAKLYFSSGAVAGTGRIEVSGVRRAVRD